VSISSRGRPGRKFGPEEADESPLDFARVPLDIRSEFDGHTTCKFSHHRTDVYYCPFALAGDHKYLRTIGNALEHLWNKSYGLKVNISRFSGVSAKKSTRFMVRAMGIEPTSEAWEALVPISRRYIACRRPRWPSQLLEIRSIRLVEAVRIKPTGLDELELTGPIELLLFLRIMHFRVQVNLRHLQRLVVQPVLDLHQVEAGAEPVSSRSFPEPEKVTLPLQWIDARIALLKFNFAVFIAMPSKPGSFMVATLAQSWRALGFKPSVQICQSPRRGRDCSVDRSRCDHYRA
jgi:hypothetical protein